MVTLSHQPSMHICFGNLQGGFVVAVLFLMDSWSPPGVRLPVLSAQLGQGYLGQTLTIKVLEDTSECSLAAKRKASEVVCVYAGLDLSRVILFIPFRANSFLEPGSTQVSPSL